MPVRIRPRHVGYACATLLLLSPVAFAAPAEVPAKLQTVPLDPDAWKELAEAAERQGKWDKALEFYLRAFLAGRQTPDIREKIKESLRHAAQNRRHRDPGFQQFVLSLPPADALNLYSEVVAKLHANYSDRDRAAPERLFELGLEELDRALSDSGFRGKHIAVSDSGKIAKFRRTLQSDWRQRLPKSPREARQAVLALATSAKDDLGLRNPSAVVFEFLCGACSGLDEYTVYLSPGHLQNELASPILEMAAYGILIAFQADGIVVEGIVPDSWAALHTPFQPGHRFVRMNGRSMQPGTPVALTEAMRTPIDNGHEIEVVSPSGMATLVRLPIPIPTVVRTEMLSPKDGIGYVRIAGLRDTTPGELDDAILELRSRGLRALILDLRGNTGGRFTAGVQVAQRFIPSGIIATTQGQAAEFANRVFSSDSGMSALDVPVVLLIDTKTMSSAEIVAGAMKDHNRATLVGMPTFGKGVIQYPFPLRVSDDDMARPRSGVLIVTIARAFSPRGSPIHGVGVTPNVVESDPQRQLTLALERALELVGGR